MGVQILSGAHYISEGYNILLARFLASNFDKLAFVEWDISWNTETTSLCAMAKKPFDYIGAATRFKKEPEEYMVGFLPERPELWGNRAGLIEVAWIPQGFAVASRAMCEKMWDASAAKEYGLHGETIREVFHDGFRDERRYGQDIGWCYDWRDMGGKVYVDPEIELTHTAAVGHAYTGRLADWLRSRMADERRSPKVAS